LAFWDDDLVGMKNFSINPNFPPYLQLGHKKYPKIELFFN